jgi:beta-lactamase superfamily II metal-dependent hydrolase
LWFGILKENEKLEMDFLDVGQGDATLIKFPFSGEILIDSGDGQQIKTALSSVKNLF